MNEIKTYVIEAILNLLLQPIQLMRKCPKAHRIQHQSAVAAGGTDGARTGVARAPNASASGDPIAGMTAL